MTISGKRLAKLALLPDINGTSEEVQMARELLKLRKRCAELEADLERHREMKPVFSAGHEVIKQLREERDAWREDARRLYNVAFTSLVDTCMSSSRTVPEVKHDYRVAHNALVAKYPAEPTKDTEWTAEEILRREG